MVLNGKSLEQEYRTNYVVIVHQSGWGKVNIYNFEGTYSGYGKSKFNPFKIMIGKKHVKELMDFSGPQDDHTWVENTLSFLIEQNKHMYVGIKVTFSKPLVVTTTKGIPKDR